VGSWQLAGVYVMESGAPLNILNGVDSDGFGGTSGSANDRPAYNSAGTPGVRAQLATTANPSPTGYINPENGNTPIDPATAMYVELRACTLPTPCTPGNLGRFTARTPIQNNLDASLTKIINLTERVRFELRAEFFNALNHRQYGIQSISAFDTGTTNISANVGTSPAGRFLNPGYADGGARVIRYQLKFVF
jgi:hypothetical protein